MASAEHEPITGVWGQSPQWGPGAQPLVRRSGGAKPPEAESILAIECPTEPANLAPSENVHSNFVTRNILAIAAGARPEYHVWGA